MTKYLDWGAISVKIHDNLLKSDALGSSQALVELWRILCRQDSIPVSARDDSFSRIVSAFLPVRQESDLFDASRTSVNTLLSAVDVKTTATGKQERLVELLVGRVRNGVPISPAENFSASLTLNASSRSTVCFWLPTA